MYGEDAKTTLASTGVMSPTALLVLWSICSSTATIIMPMPARRPAATQSAPCAAEAVPAQCSGTRATSSGIRAYKAVQRPARRSCSRHGCAVASAEEPAESVNVGALIGYGLLLAYLSPVFLTAAAKVGLYNPPPINLLTDIANNAADEAMAAGSLELGRFFGYTIQGGTFYAQSVWKDLLAEYYSTGETTEFLTRAGGICAQHAAWCKGVSIPP